MDQLVYRNNGERFCFCSRDCFVHASGGCKLAVDFNPNLDFSKFKTFAFIAALNTFRIQLNPDSSITRFIEPSPELTAKDCASETDESPT